MLCSQSVLSSEMSQFGPEGQGAFSRFFPEREWFSWISALLVGT